VDDIRRIAYEIVLRACGFGSLTIFCIMIGLSFNPRVSFQSGGFLTTVMTLILALKAYEARRKPYRRTEMWLYLPEDARPPAGSAQQITSAIMREVYLTFAVWTSIIAIGMWGVALFLSFIGP
jgi:multisubunit Na+/H+ antiporter MnhB subunit